MTTQQPQWKFLANLGDVNPLDYGGYFIFEDQTGVYPPEAELLIAPDEDDSYGPGRYEVRRFILDKCTYIDGILSDNEFHPNHPAWFANDLASVASFIGSDTHELIAWLCSDEPLQRAHAYRAIGDYHGWDNLDSYPLELNRDEARARYSAHPYAPVNPGPRQTR